MVISYQFKPLFKYFCNHILFQLLMDNTDQEIKDLISNLTERNKELNCLYSIDAVLKDYDLNLTNVFDKIIAILPSAFRYSDICKAQVIYKDEIIKSFGFKQTELKLATKIYVDNKSEGEIQVYYIQPVKQEKGIFIPEEKKLIQTIAERIGNYLSYRQLRELIGNENIENSDKINLDTDFYNWLKSCYFTEVEIKKITQVKIEFRKGETICKQGSFASYIMMLKKGLVKAGIENGNTKNFTYKITKPFSFIGLSTLYGDNYYHFSSTALIPSTVYLIEKTTFDNILKTNPKFFPIVMQWYCKAFEHVYYKMNSVANKQALGRIAETLLYLYEKIFDNRIISNIISRKDIAEMAGMSTENAVRVLSELKRDKIIKINSCGIEIINKDLLHTISMAG